MNRDFLSEEHSIFRDTVRRFIVENIQPYHRQWEQDGCVSTDLWRRAGELGLLCPNVPEEYGGVGGDFLYNAIVVEELAESFYSGPLFGFMVHSDIVAAYIVNYGSEEQKRQWLPRMVRGEAITAIGMSEPSTGSDLSSIKTTATPDGDYYVVNGSKTFISNGQLADMVLMVVKTAPNIGAKGISLIIVESDRPGFSRGRKLEKLGMKAQDTSELFFDDLKVPKENLLGEEGGGFGYLMQSLPRERIAISIAAMGACHGAYRETLEYTRERTAFGKPIIDFQNTRFRLAELKAEMAAGQALLNHGLKCQLEGNLDATTAAICKLFTTELQGRVVDACVQLFGGYGYMLEYPITRAYADARVQRIYGGTSEIMKELIGRNL